MADIDIVPKHRNRLWLWIVLAIIIIAIIVIALASGHAPARSGAVLGATPHPLAWFAVFTHG